MTTKRKREYREGSGRFDWLQVRPVEFLSPLPLDKCVRRLRQKRTIGRKANRLDVYITQETPGSYRFLLERTIVHEDIRRGQSKQVFRATGKLSYWDDESTLVYCRPASRTRPLLYGVFGMLLAVMAFGLVAGIKTALLTLVLMAFTLAALLFFVFLNTHEHRRLIAMVDDMLRDPIFY